MLSDDEARDLLHRAGETVPVDPTRQIAEPPRRPAWPILVAAAAVVAIAVTSVLLVDRGGDDGPDPAPAGPETVQVPSVLGYDQGEAEQALRDAGFVVSSSSVPGCAVSGTALRTTPAAGTRLASGADVRIEISDGLPYCAPTPTDLLAFADGRGPAPKLADTIRIHDRDGTAEISAAEAADPETWRTCASDEVCTSVLARLSEAAHRFYPMDTGSETTYQSPALTTEPPAPCSFEPAPPALGQPAQQVGVTTLVDGQLCTQEFVLDIHQDSRGAITAVALRERQPRTTTQQPEPESDDEVARQLRAFALGDGELPPMADEVTLYLGNAFTGVVTPDSARDRAAWQTCTEVGSYAARTCPFSPLAVLAQHRQVDYVDAPQGLCMPTYGPLPPDLRKADRVTIVPTEESIESCMQNFAVQVITDDDGELIAVSLLLGEP